MPNTSDHSLQAAPRPGVQPAYPLFRPEVMEARSSQWMGAIRLAQPASGWLVAGIAVAITVALIAFITLGSFSKKARVTGITTPAGGTITISANTAGTLIRRLVSEGQTVRAGQVLFELSTERHGTNGELTALLAQQMAIRQQTLDAERRTRISTAAEKKASIDARLRNLEVERTQLDEELILARRRLALAQQSLKKFETLQASGFVSAAQTQEKQESLIDLGSRLGTLTRTKVQLETNRLSVEADRQSLSSDLATALAQLDRAQASLRQESVENADRRTSLITAPEAGTLTTMTNQAGQSVTGGQVLASLIPARIAGTAKGEDLEVHLYAQSRTAGFVAVGQTVLIRYQAYPYQKFGLYEGKVIDISKTPFAPNELPTNVASTILSNAQQSSQGFNTNEAMYRIKVKPLRQFVNAYGKQAPLKPGMTLEADILQDRRKIWEWVIEPFLAVVPQA